MQASLTPADVAGSTVVAIDTSLNVTGRPAQFGRSLLPEVSGKLIAQFATNLQALINRRTRAADTEAPAAEATEAATPETAATEADATSAAEKAAPVTP